MELRKKFNSQIYCGARPSVRHMLRQSLLPSWKNRPLAPRAKGARAIPVSERWAGRMRESSCCAWSRRGMSGTWAAPEMPMSPVRGTPPFRSFRPCGEGTELAKMFKRDRRVDRLKQKKTPFQGQCLHEFRDGGAGSDMKRPPEGGTGKGGKEPHGTRDRIGPPASQDGHGDSHGARTDVHHPGSATGRKLSGNGPTLRGGRRAGWVHR